MEISGPCDDKGCDAPAVAELNGRQLCLRHFEARLAVAMEPARKIGELLCGSRAAEEPTS